MNHNHENYRSARVVLDIPTLPHIKKGDLLNIEAFSKSRASSWNGREAVVYKAWRPGQERHDAFFVFDYALGDFSPLTAEKREKLRSSYRRGSNE